MLRRLTHVMSFVSLLLAFISISYAEPQKLILDNQHTYVLWEVKHLGFSTQAGKWYASGELVLDKDHPDKSKVNASIKVGDIVTGLPELDEHLKGKLFFDVAQFPIATFESTKVHVLSKTKAKVQGNLTLHGVTKPVTLHVTLNKIGVNPLTDRNTVGFTATATIRRSDFGIKAIVPEVSDDVRLQIGVEAYQDKK